MNKLKKLLFLCLLGLAAGVASAQEFHRHKLGNAPHVTTFNDGSNGCHKPYWPFVSFTGDVKCVKGEFGPLVLVDVIEPSDEGPEVVKSKGPTDDELMYSSCCHVLTDEEKARIENNSQK